MEKTFSTPKLIALSCMLATVGFLTACNTGQQLNCNPYEVAYQMAAKENDTLKMA